MSKAKCLSARELFFKGTTAASLIQFQHSVVKVISMGGNKMDYFEIGFLIFRNPQELTWSTQKVQVGLKFIEATKVCIRQDVLVA